MRSLEVARSNTFACDKSLLQLPPMHIPAREAEPGLGSSLATRTELTLQQRPICAPLLPSHQISTDPAAEVVAEAALAPADRAAATRLLAAEWGDDWVPDGYAGPYPPGWRILVRESGELIGHLSLFAVPTTPALRLIGFGDLVVAPASRGSGVGRALVAAGVAAPPAVTADVLVVDTVAAAATFAAHGFAPVRPWSFFYVSDGACRRHPHWLVRANRALPARVELLANGDF